jgi:hypothetical protein
MTVHSTSISVLCVVADGVGLAFALKRRAIHAGRQHEQADRGDDVEDEGVQPDDVAHAFVARGLQPELPGRRLTFGGLLRRRRRTACRLRQML